MPLSPVECLNRVCTKREQQRFSARHEGGVSSRTRSDPASEGATWLRSGNYALACDADRNPARHRRARWPSEMPGPLTIFVIRFTTSKTGVELSSGSFIVQWEYVHRRRVGVVRAYFLQTPPPIGSPVRLWSMKAADAWLYSSLGNQPEIKRLFIESELFPWIFTARSTLYLVLLFASTSLSCRSRVMVVLFTLFKLAFIKLAFEAIEHLQNLNYA
jgi:hypothetical protein